MSAIIIPKRNIWTPPSKWQTPWVGDAFPWLEEFGRLIQLSVSAFPSAITGGDQGSPVVTISDITQTSTGNTCSWEVQRDGDLQLLAPTNTTRTNEWVTSGDKEATIGDLYEARITKTSGFNEVLTNWSNGVYSTINNNKKLTLNPSFGTTTYVGTLDIREIADTGNIDTAAVSMTANP